MREIRAEGLSENNTNSEKDVSTQEYQQLNFLVAIFPIEMIKHVFF